MLFFSINVRFNRLNCSENMETLLKEPILYMALMMYTKLKGTHSKEKIHILIKHAVEYRVSSYCCVQEQIDKVRMHGVSFSPQA